jgi:hypothetical protein
LALVAVAERLGKGVSKMDEWEGKGSGTLFKGPPSIS